MLSSYIITQSLVKQKTLNLLVFGKSKVYYIVYLALKHTHRDLYC